MLGEQIGESRGRVTSRGILPGGEYRYIQRRSPSNSRAPSSAKDYQEVGTYTVLERRYSSAPEAASSAMRSGL